MRSLWKYASSAVVAVALAASGCLKSDQTITVYPDGSGKVEMKGTVFGMMAQMLRARAMPPMGGDEGGGGGGRGGMGGGMGGMGGDPFEILKKELGRKIYWSNLKAEDGAQGEYVISGTGYFEDVNQLGGKQNISFKPADGGEGYVFELKGLVPERLLQQIRSAGGGGGGGGDKKNMTPEQEQMVAMLRAAMAGFGVKTTVVMPGVVTSAEGMQKAAEASRQATFSLTQQDAEAMMDAKQEPPNEAKIVCKAADAAGLEAELAAFKKELAAAKAQSQKDAEASKPAPKGDKKPAGDEKGGEKKGERKAQDF